MKRKVVRTDVFVVLEAYLGSILGPEAVIHAYIDPAVIPAPGVGR